MKVDTMRKIDYWLGIPICLLMIPLAKLCNFFNNRLKINDRKKNILFIELSEMGSAILADPAMHQAKDKYNIFFVIFTKNKPSLSLLDTVPDDNIFCISDKSLFHMGFSVCHFIVWCRGKHIDISLDLELFSRFTALLSLFSWAGERVGFASGYDEGLWRGKLLTREIRYNPHQHISVNFIALVDSLAGEFHSIYPNKHITLPVITSLSKESIEINKFYNEMIQLYSILEKKRWLVFNTHSSDLLPQRRWPQESFADTARQLLDKFDDIVILLTGTKSEDDYIRTIEQQINQPRVVNLVGKTNFDELILLFYNATLLLSSDSGPPHFAAPTSLKTFVLFGPETPNLYRPLGNTEVLYLGLACSPCVSAANHRKTSCQDNKCMTEIKPQQVVARITEYLVAPAKPKNHNKISN